MAWCTIMALTSRTCFLFKLETYLVRMNACNRLYLTRSAMKMPSLATPLRWRRAAWEWRNFEQNAISCIEIRICLWYSRYISPTTSRAIRFFVSRRSFQALNTSLYSIALTRKMPFSCRARNYLVFLALQFQRWRLLFIAASASFYLR